MTMMRQKQKGGPKAQADECRRTKGLATDICCLQHLPALKSPGPHPPATPATVSQHSLRDSKKREVINHRGKAKSSKELSKLKIMPQTNID